MASISRSKISRSLFKEVVARGKTFHTPYISIKILPSYSQTTTPLFSVVVSTKVAKTAVGRNLIKRRIRAIFYQLRPNLAQQSVIIVFTKPNIATVPMSTLTDSITDSLKTCGIVLPS